MKLKDYIIIALLVGILLQRECGSGSGGVVDSVFIGSEKIYDSTRYFFPVLQPAVIKSVSQLVPQDVDTSAILQKFFTENHYQGSLGDSNLVVNWDAFVYMNSMNDFNLSYKILRAKEEKKFIIAQPKNKVFLGPMAGLDQSGRFYFGPQALLITKKDNCYTADIDLLNRGVRAGVLWKLSLKPKK